MIDITNVIYFIITVYAVWVVVMGFPMKRKAHQRKNNKDSRRASKLPVSSSNNLPKVNGGSLAEKAGLQVADAVIKVNGQEVYNLKHKDAQDTIVKAGNSFEVVVSRGPGGTWKPTVTPVGNVPSPTPLGGAPSPVTKTSLAYKGPPSPVIGTGHNTAARPFSSTPQLNGVGEHGSLKSITSKQYNNPVGLYSEQTIAETLSAQAEVLAGGVLGVNFMKNEKTYNSTNSEVLKMVQEIDKEPKDPEPVERQSAVGDNSSSSSRVGYLRVGKGLLIVVRPSSVTYYAAHSHMVGGRATSPRPMTPHAQQLPPPLPDRYPPQMAAVTDSPKCTDCNKLIVGVFVRIKDKNLHVECFKCATCGTSLKNVGYYNINNKLYCDIHAKLVARSNPPAPNLDPITIPPGGRIPSGVVPAPQPSMGSQSPQPGTLAPLPFHAPRMKPSHVSAPRTLKTPTSTLSGPKPFGAPAHASVPFSTPSAPVSAPAPVPPPFSSAPFSSVPPPPLAPSSVPAPPSFSTFPKSLPGQIPPKPLAKKAGESVTSTISDTLKSGDKYPVCNVCDKQITRGPFITALGKIWCPEHFVCVNTQCRRPLQDIGFVEEAQGLYCEYCFEQYLAPTCNKCNAKVKGDCLNAIGKHFHPECFTCAYCGKLFGNSPFFLEDALPYCETDWNELFTTKCFSCGFPIEAGDRWVEALNNNYHSQCFNCTMCKKNLEGQSFFAKGGRPFCKNHAR